MAHFYGTVKGQRGEASRLGNTKSGLTTKAAGWGGAIRTDVFINEETGEDWYRVTLTPWKGSGGDSRVLSEGRLSSREES